MPELLETMCVLGSCPSIFKKPDGDLIIIGKEIQKDNIEAHVLKKIGQGEIAIEVPVALIEKLLAKRK